MHIHGTKKWGSVNWKIFSIALLMLDHFTMTGSGLQGVKKSIQPSYNNIN